MTTNPSTTTPPSKCQKPPTNKKPKLLFTLNTPFPAIQWPDVPPTTQTTILEHLLQILSPIGARKRLLPPSPSTTKRNKRKRRKLTSTTATTTDLLPPPPPPEITKYLAIGLNSTTAHLEGLAGERRPAAFPPSPSPTENAKLKKPKMKALFVTRADSQSSLLHSHIPLLCSLASGDGEDVVRLVQLPRGAEARVADALGIARAGFVGLLEGAPEEVVGGLMEVVRGCVGRVKVPWLEEGEREHMGVDIKVVKTFATVQEKGKGKGKEVKGSAPA
ncbi:hypothetical protein L873DRAFT_1829638 [Choiromyces venosus 120613-1]|uniref:Uncharacterized protein n=1 Tax=Choiromyces venosus 120613-1 TaxID=1336337 RepID=A0A3N4JGD1_9PEZI|nr:hypothetical protein L873DRAFT_1829638 [Choiromyces venosus 120613-1]